MKILERYLLKNFLGPLLFCTFFFFAMFIFVDGFNNLDEFMKHGTPARLVAAYYAAMFPLVTNQIMPAAALLAALFFIGNMNRHHEISAMKASGVSGFRILLPVLSAGFLLSVAVFVVNETAAPRAAALTAAIKRGLVEDGPGAFAGRTLRNVTLLAGDNRMVYARELALDTGSLHEVIVLEQDPDLGVKSKTTAEKGIWSEDGWVFYNAVRVEFDRRGAVIGVPVAMKKADSGIREGPLEFIRQDTEMQFMNTRQLRRHIEQAREAGFKPSNRILVELYHKAVSPFASFVILVVGGPAAIRIRQGGALIHLGMGLSLVAAYYLAIAVSLALGKGGFFPPALAAAFPHTFFLAAGAVLMRRSA